MADAKLTALSAMTTATTDDIMYIVDDPTGTPASKKITIANLIASLKIVTWNNVTGTSASASVNNGYLANNASLVTITLPSSSAVLDIVRIAGVGAGGWKLAQNASGYVQYGNQITTVGTGGFLSSVNQYDAVELICTATNNGWTVISSQGNVSVT